MASGKVKVIDAAVKYGYDSPDSFAKAFRKFHGVNPSEAPGAALRSFSPLRIKLTLEGASMLHYKIEEKPELILTGFKRRFEGSPAQRKDQETTCGPPPGSTSLCSRGWRRTGRPCNEVISRQDDSGYDFHIAWELDPYDRDHLAEVLNDPDFAARYEKITVPAGLYLVCETERCEYPTRTSRSSAAGW